MDERSETEVVEVDVNFLDVALRLTRHRVKLILLPMLFAVVAAGVSMVLPWRYTASLLFAPEPGQSGGGLPGGLSGLATQFGLSSASNGTPPEYYVQLLQTRTILDRVLATQFNDYRTEVVGDSANLLVLLGVEPSDSLTMFAAGRRAITNSMNLSFNPQTTIVGLSVTTPDGELSAATANRLVELLEQFNVDTRQSSARERRRFMEQRLGEIRTELTGTEGHLQLFLEQNRGFSGSPAKSFEHDRLERETFALREVLSGVQNSYEEARLQEVDDVPQITVLDRAQVPDSRSSPRRRSIVVFWFVLGLGVALVVVVVQEAGRGMAERYPEMTRELKSRWIPNR
jgi:tyrosine-protein kinase Etk/Wzc